MVDHKVTNFEHRILIILPFLGGGTERHVKDMIEAWRDKNLLVVVHYVDRAVSVDVVAGKYCTSNKFFQNDARSFEFLKQLMEQYHIEMVHVHHLWYKSKALEQFYLGLQVPLVITLHDYYVVCPFTNMFNRQTRRFCGRPDALDCNQCISVNKSFLIDNVTDIDSYRRENARILSKASMVIAPSGDSKKRVNYFFPSIAISRKYNPEAVKLPIGLRRKDALSKEHKTKRIGLLGTLSIIKGATTLKKVAELAWRSHEPLQFVLFGKLVSPLDKVIKLPPSVKVMGPYNEISIYQEIVDEDIDFFWFPPLCPETYSYTLSIPSRLGIPSICVDLGALAERVNHGGWGETYPCGSSSAEILRRLKNFDFYKYKVEGNFDMEAYEFGKVEDFYNEIEFSHNEVNVSKIDQNAILNKQDKFCPRNLSWQEFHCARKMGLNILKCIFKLDKLALLNKILIKYRYIKSLRAHLYATD